MYKRAMKDGDEFYTDGKKYRIKDDGNGTAKIVNVKGEVICDYLDYDEDECKARIRSSVGVKKMKAMKMRKMKKSAVSPSELGIRQPSSIKASTSYGTLVLSPTSVGDGRWGYFGEISVHDEDIAVYIYINSVDKDSLEEYDDEISYECDFTENYYNRETEREEEYDNGTVYLSIDLSDAYGRFEDMGWTVESGISSVVSGMEKSKKKSVRKSKKHYLDHPAYHTPGYDMEDEEEWHYFFGYCDSGNPDDIEVGGGESDMDAIDNSRDFAGYYTYVSASYGFVSKEELIACIRKDGWWFVDGEETEDDGFPVDDVYKSKKSRAVRKVPMSVDANGDSIWVDAPMVTIPDTFDLTINGETVQFYRTDDWDMDGIGLKRNYGKMWEGFIGDDNMFALAIDPDGKFEGCIIVYDDYDSKVPLGLNFPNFNDEFKGQNSNQEVIVQNFERYCNNMYPRLLVDAEQFMNEYAEYDFNNMEKSRKIYSHKTRSRKGEGAATAGSAGMSSAVFTDNPDKDDTEKCGSIEGLIASKKKW